MILIEEQFDGIEVAASEDGKKTYLKGVFMEAETKNQNGRIYDRQELEGVVHLINDKARLGRHILGELDHPSVLDVRLENVSHRLMEAHMDGNQIIAKAQVLESHPKGAILKALLNEGVRVGVSSRGAGKLDASTNRVSKYRFVCCDAVANPSARSAYPETIMEQLEMADNGDEIHKLSHEVSRDPLAQRYFEIEMRRFISNLKG